MRAARLRVLLNPCIAVLAMLPGFLLPFILTVILGPRVSDPFFLAISVSLILTNVLGNTIELNSVVQIGRVLARTGTVSRRAVRRYRRKVRKFVMISTLLGGAILIFVYSISILPEIRSSFVIVAVIALAIPLVGGEASTRSGQLIACGRQEIPILMQATRSLAPLLIVIMWPTASVYILAVSMVAGEIIRLVVLHFLAVRVEESALGATTTLETRGLIVQSISTSAVQLAPVADRLFLSSAPTGSLSAYELADKVFFAGAQFLNLSYLVGRVQRWSGLRSVPRSDGDQILRRDLMVLVGFSAVSSVLAVSSLFLLQALVSLPEEWQQGLQWSQWILLSLPFALVSMACSRLLVVAGRQNLLLWFAAFITAATILADWILFSFWGAIGIPLAGVIVRLLTSVVYVLVTLRCIKSVIGIDLRDSHVTGQDTSLRVLE